VLSRKTHVPPEVLCARCGRQPVAACLSGSIRVDEYTARECPNLKLVRVDTLLRSRLSPDLYEAPRITESPLYTPGKNRGEPALINRTKENLFIRGVTLGGLLPHLRLVFACLPIRYKIVDDSRLRDVFVGAESYTSKTKALRDQKESNNVVADLIGKNFDLIVIRLGVLCYKNIAAAGVLREALMVREGLAKATWLFEDSDPTIRWEHSRDLDVENYVKPRFQDVWLEATGPVAEVENHISVDEDDTEREAPAEYMELVPQEEKLAASLVEDVPVENEGFDNLFGGGSTKPPFKKWSPKKRGG
jgi:hypothetical protein